jgi:hypothetical protein
MEIVKFVYSEQEIDFDLSKQEIMVNATEMAKIFGKEVSGFLKIEQTDKFIKAYCQTEDLPFENEFSPTGNLIKIIKGHATINGTWMHRVVALKFAAWLDPMFEVWVFKTIDKLINQNFKEQRDALVERLTAKQKKALKKEEIIKKYDHIPEIKEYFDLEDLEKTAKKKQLAAVRDQVKQLQINF